MRIGGLSKQQRPFTDAHRKVRAAIEAGEIADDADATALLLTTDNGPRTRL